jgi:ribonuclease HI
MDQRITLNFDGGSRGNPGPSGIGFVLSADDGTPLLAAGRFIGHATNNVAEYTALIAGLREAKKLGANKILVRGDSELIVKQMRGEYRVKNPALRELFDQAQQLLSQFKHASLEHNLRHKNVLADKLANLAMDKRKDVTDADLPAGSDAVSTDDAANENHHTCPKCGCEIEITRPGKPSSPHHGPFICPCGGQMEKR